MTIEELLKDKTENFILTSYRRWLVWDEEKWEVYEQPYHKQGQRIYCGDLLEEALKVLARKP